MALASACCVPLSRASRISVCAFLVGNDRGCWLRSSSMPAFAASASTRSCIGRGSRPYLARAASRRRRSLRPACWGRGRTDGSRHRPRRRPAARDGLVEPRRADEAPGADDIGEQIDLEGLRAWRSPYPLRCCLNARRARTHTGVTCSRSAFGCTSTDGDREPRRPAAGERRHSLGWRRRSANSSRRQHRRPSAGARHFRRPRIVAAAAKQQHRTGRTSRAGTRRASGDYGIGEHHRHQPDHPPRRRATARCRSARPPSGPCPRAGTAAAATRLATGAGSRKGQQSAQRTAAASIPSDRGASPDTTTSRETGSNTLSASPTTSLRLGSSAKGSAVFGVIEAATWPSQCRPRPGVP